MMLKPPYSEQSSFALAARITVMNKLFLKYGRQTIVQEMMHNPVPEICGKDFPADRITDYKTNACAYDIASRAQFMVERGNIFFEMKFKTKLG